MAKDNFVRIDYSAHKHDREKMTNYLSAGGFRSCGKNRFCSRTARRARILLIIISVAIILTGLYFVIV